MAFFAMLFLIFAVVRLGRVHRRGLRRGYAYGAHPHWQLQRIKDDPRLPSVAERRESRFDTLKRRYVKGELSDEQYESELDELLRTPEGRSEVN